MNKLKKTHNRLQEIHIEIRKLKFDINDLRFSTPYAFANYRAKKLKCDTIADIGCGLGFQSFAFAKECKKVIAVDISKERIESAETNARILGIKNITFIHGDALSKDVIEKIRDEKPDIIFCDPERLEEEEKRSLETIRPDIDRLVQSYSHITPEIAIELPPFLKDIKYNCEKEYLYLNERKHLTIYMGNLKKNETSAILLPENAKISWDESIGKEEREKLLEAGFAKNYIYEIKEVVNMAGLIPELIKKFPGMNLSVLEINKHTFLSSDKKMENILFKNVLNVLETVDNEYGLIMAALKRQNAKHVVLRFSIPSSEYWDIRKRYEDRLNGDKKLHLFVFLNRAVICELISPLNPEKAKT
jgi:SAM-dependent methyltransferase